MAFPAGDMFLYSAPSAAQQIRISSGTKPEIEIISNPAEISNSLQAHFSLEITMGGTVVPEATLYYKFDDASGYTSRGANRTIDVITSLSGPHQIAFLAQYNNVYSEEVFFNWNIDTTRPSVISTLPANASGGVDNTSGIEITFSEPMRVSSVTNAISITPTTVGTWNATNNGSRFVFTPSASMGNNQRYTVSIANTAEDLAGNKILSQFQFYFTTIMAVNKQPEQPTVVANNPARISYDKPRFVFTVPADPENDRLHFVVELANNSTLSSGFMQFSSNSNPSYFTYYDNAGNKTHPFPATGATSGNGKIVFQMPTSLVEGSYWFRAIADDGRL